MRRLAVRAAAAARRAFFISPTGRNKPAGIEPASQSVSQSINPLLLSQQVLKKTNEVGLGCKQ
jgi:hypothetical protein